MNWLSVLQTLGVSTILAAIVVFLGRSLIKALLSKDIEKFKADLQIQVLERQTVFTKLHEQRAAVIAELYSQLLFVDSQIENYIHSSEAEDDWEKIENILRQFEAKTIENAIYLDEATFLKLTAFVHKTWEIWTTTMVGLEDTLEQKTIKWNETDRQYAEDLQKLKNDLQIIFRGILGEKSGVIGTNH